MEPILTVEDVAKILHVTPFTVRQMFRDGRLSGFKVGKAWRITESVLQADLGRMQGPAQGAAVAREPEQQPEPVEPEAAPESVSEERTWASTTAADVGHLLVFSEVPGQEVFLDGVRRGVTTLPIANIPAGEHTLRVADVTARVLVSKDTRIRVSLAGRRLEVLSEPQVVAPALPLEQRGADQPANYRLVVNLDNRTDFSGRFCVRLAAEDVTRTTEMFVGAGMDISTFGLTLVEGIVPEAVTLLFDGVMRARAGDKFTLSVPRQPGFDGEVSQLYTVQADTEIQLTLARGGMFRAKDTIRFRVSTDLD